MSNPNFMSFTSLDPTSHVTRKKTDYEASPEEIEFTQQRIKDARGRLADGGGTRLTVDELGDFIKARG